MKKSILFIPLLSLLSACVPPLTRDQQLAIYRSRCLDYGYQWGTREFADCMKEQEFHDETLAIQNRKANALEEQNRIAHQKVQIKTEEIEIKRKKKKR